MKKKRKLILWADKVYCGYHYPALLPFCEKEFVDLGFQVRIRNPEFVGGYI